MTLKFENLPAKKPTYGYIQQISRLVLTIGSVCVVSLFYSVTSLIRTFRGVSDVEVFLLAFEHVRSCKAVLKRVAEECVEVLLLLGNNNVLKRYANVSDVYEVTFAVIGSEVALDEDNQFFQNSKINLYEELNKIRLEQIDLKYINPIVIIHRFTAFLNRIATLGTKPLISESSLYSHKMTLVVEFLLHSLAQFTGATLTGILYFEQGSLSLPALTMHARSSITATENLEFALQLDRPLRDSWTTQQQQLVASWAELESMEHDILHNVSITNISNVKLLTWLHRTGLRNDILNDALDHFIDRFISEAEKTKTGLGEYITYKLVILGMVLALVLPFNLVSSYVMASTLTRYVRQMEKKSEEILKEKKKRENITKDLFPKSVAQQLLLGGKVASEHFEAVTILCSDVADFAEHCTNTSPYSLVNFLNQVYSFIDSHIRQYDVYKVLVIVLVMLKLLYLEILKKINYQ